MATARKTANVAAIVTRANRYMARPDLTAEQKQGIALLLDGILHETGQYAGFGYTEQEVHPVENRDQWTADMEASRAYFMRRG